MRTLSYLSILSVVISLSGQSVAQQPDATVVFRLFWKQAHPSKYTITVHRSGQAEYVSEDPGLNPPQERNTPVESNAEQTVQSEDAASQDALRKPFQASEALRQKIFALAERTHFFEGEFEFTKHAVANTGKKTLSYSDGSHKTSTTYNYSEDLSIQELTDIFQGISSTVEGGQRLEYDRRFDKLSLDQDLKALEEESNQGRLQEVQVIAPILRRLANDRTVLHIAQMRAERILKKAGQPVETTAAQ